MSEKGVVVFPVGTSSSLTEVAETEGLVHEVARGEVAETLLAHYLVAFIAPPAGQEGV